MAALLRDIRLYIYAQMVATSVAPSAADTARTLGCPLDEAEAGYRALADAHVIVLRPCSTTVWMAMPFSNMPTAYNVIAGGRAYYAPCALGAFGIPAALGMDARVFTTCADCGGALERRVSAGALTDTRGLVHLAVPARRWWDDVGSTCATTLLFESEEHLGRWCAKKDLPRGEVLTLDQTWTLAKLWFQDRLDPAWRPLTPAEANDAFASIGLTGEFWKFG